MTEPSKNATIMCKKHKKRAAISICYECGKPICWLCRRGPDKWAGGHLCEDCYKALKKKEKKRTIVIGVLVLILLSSLIAIPFIEGYLEEEPEGDLSNLLIARVEPYIIDASGNRSIDVGVKIYLTHEGEKASEDVQVELLLKVDGITYKSGSEVLGKMDGDVTKVADIEPFTITPGTYDLDIIIWEDSTIKTSTTNKLVLSQGGKDEIETWWEIDTNDGGKIPSDAAAGSGGGEEDEAGTSAALIVIIAFIIIILIVALAFTRIPRRWALHHPKRDTLYNQIQSQPGIPAAELQQQTGLARGTMDHHLKALENHGMVRSYTDGTNKRFVPGEMRTVTDRVDTPRQMILEFLKNGPGSSQKEIAEQLGLPLQTVNYHVNNMKMEGIVKIEYEGKESRVFLNGET